MSNEVEKKFFEVFNIPKTKLEFECGVIACPNHILSGKFACITCSHKSKQEILDYPQITAQRLLELLVVASDCDDLRVFKNVNDLKNTVLNILINCYNKFLHWDCKTGEEWATEIKNKVLEIFEDE